MRTVDNSAPRKFSRRSFDEFDVSRARNMPLRRALEVLHLDWRRDADYRPVKDCNSVSVHVLNGSQAFHLIVTGAKWYDVRAKRGGCGAIDLAMHVLRVPFVDAVKMLTAGGAQ